MADFKKKKERVTNRSSITNDETEKINFNELQEEKNSEINDPSKIHPIDLTINGSIRSEKPMNVMHYTMATDEQIETVPIKSKGKNSFDQLREVIAKALNQKFEEEKKKELLDLATYSPIFEISHFTKAFIYHMLFFVMFGPMIAPILICFESFNYIKNMGFLPGKD